MKKSVPDLVLLFYIMINIFCGCGSDKAEFKGAVHEKISPAPAIPQSADETISPQVQPPEQNSQSLPESTDKSLIWLWQCEDEQNAFDLAKGETLVQGDQNLSLSQPEVPITFVGSLCHPENNPRDIVFVLDISGSMTSEFEKSDPLINGSCGRLDAVKTLVEKMPKTGEVQFSIVTFSHEIGAKSSGYFVTEADLFKDLGNKPVTDYLCAGEGGTYYSIALAAAKDLLLKGREGATKEIYFISDGGPDLGQDGITEADDLKTNGIVVSDQKMPVVIATVMLKGNDEADAQLNTISSADQNGQKYHAKVDKALELGKAVAILAENKLVIGFLKYRQLHQIKWENVDILSKVDDNLDFTFGPILVKVGDGGFSGIEAWLGYWDSKDTYTEKRAVIRWELEKK